MMWAAWLTNSAGPRPAGYSATSGPARSTRVSHLGQLGLEHHLGAPLGQLVPRDLPVEFSGDQGAHNLGAQPVVGLLEIDSYPVVADHHLQVVTLALGVDPHGAAASC